ncbi:hypothetical protein [Streptomyces sp. NPDC058579]|uniref:hypothetical protein n=1 Tax=Streptomyces sp. NPDC058579 TaxID=3346548 RepID=UPI00364664D2
MSAWDTTLYNTSFNPPNSWWWQVLATVLGLTDAVTACESVGMGGAEDVADPDALQAAAVGEALAPAAEPDPSLQAARPMQHASASAAMAVARP